MIWNVIIDWIAGVLAGLLTGLQPVGDVVSGLAVDAASSASDLGTLVAKFGILIPWDIAGGLLGIWLVMWVVWVGFALLRMVFWVVNR